MYSGSYTSDGVKGLLKEGGTARRDETTRSRILRWKIGSILLVLW